jgi:hypothetical protein
MSITVHDHQRSQPYPVNVPQVQDLPLATQYLIKAAQDGFTQFGGLLFQVTFETDFVVAVDVDQGGVWGAEAEFTNMTLPERFKRIQFVGRLLYDVGVMVKGGLRPGSSYAVSSHVPEWFRFGWISEPFRWRP